MAKRKLTGSEAAVRAPKGSDKTRAGHGKAAALKSVETPDASFWAVETAWSLLLAALVFAPLLITNISWIPGLQGTWLHSGPAALKALTAQALVGAALGCFCFALLTGRATLRRHRIIWWAAAFLAWSGITVLTSVSPATALVGYTTNAEGWMTLLTYGAAGFLTLQLADTPARIRALLKTTSLTAAAIAVYGLVQTLGLDPLTWQAGSWGLFRSFSTIGNPDMFGAYMVLNLFVLVGLLLGETDRRWRAAYAIAVLAVGAATFTSLARAAWLGAIVGGAVFAVLARRLKPKVTRGERYVALALVVAVAGAALLSLPNSDVDSNVVSRVRTAFDPADKNTLGRTETWRVAATAIGKRPVTGYGPDTFGLAFQPNKTEALARLLAPNIVQANAHSSVIQLATESGIVGVLLWLAMLGTTLYLAWTVVAPEGKGAPSRLLLAGALASVAGYLAASLLSPSSPPLGLLLWCLLACLISPLAAPAAPGRARKPASMAGIAVGVLAVGVAVAFLVADARAVTADDDGAAVPARLAAADAAVRFDPLSAENAAVAAKAYAQGALQEGAAAAPDRALIGSRFSAAYGFMRRSVALEPTSPHRRSTLVSLLLIGGDTVDPKYKQAALRAADAARHDAPNDLETLYWYARSLHSEGRGAEAVPVLERVLRLRPTFADAAVLLSDLYAARGDEAAARRVLDPLADEGLPAVRDRLERLGAKSGG